MAPKDLDKLIEKYLQGTCSEEERELINSWYASLGSEARQPDNFAEGRLDAAEEKILKNIQVHSTTDTNPFAQERQVRHFWRYAGIAATLLLCALAVFYMFPVSPPSIVMVDPPSGKPMTVIENPSTASKRVILPDGSIVEMSPESSIRYLEESNESGRELYLEGEAYFDVAHNNTKPFYVYAGNVVTKVLGTTFIVRAMGEDEKVTVSVKTGKVTVYSKNSEHKKTVLVRHQQAVYDRTTDVVATQAVSASDASPVAEKSTEMHFEETPVPEVLRILKQTYEIEIVFAEEALAECVLTSSFFDEGLYDRIDVICTAIGATYDIVDSEIVIESQGCNLKTN